MFLPVPSWLLVAFLLHQLVEGAASANPPWVMLYEHSDYLGASFNVTVNSDCVWIPSFQDKASSAATRSVAGSSDCATLWDNWDCSGASLNFRGALRLTDGLNDQTSAISGCGYLGGGVSATSGVTNWPYAIPNPPPATWQEHWFEHNQLLSRVFYNDDVAVYYDSSVNRAITWPFQYLTELWRYTKNTYGSLGPDNRLYAILHTGKYGGGHPATYNDATHDNRTVIDIGSGDANAWMSGQGNDLDIVTHEVMHIVEGASNRIIGSPAFLLWGDSKWAEIFIYDAYGALGKTADQTRWYNLMMAGSGDSFPRSSPPSFWFRDWFYPIYRDNGRTQLLQNYFTMLARHFPTDNNGVYWKQYSRRMASYGEFVHFWSGAAGTALKPQFRTAFGWTAQQEQDYRKAQNDFPRIRYAHMSD